MRSIGDLISAIKASQAEISLSLAHGSASTWEAYHRLVGQHQGLQQTLDIINTFLKEEDEDER
jgi:hypothetical protein